MEPLTRAGPSAHQPSRPRLQRCLLLDAPLFVWSPSSCQMMRHLTRWTNSTHGHAALLQHSECCSGASSPAHGCLALPTWFLQPLPCLPHSKLSLGKLGHDLAELELQLLGSRLTMGGKKAARSDGVSGRKN